MRARIIGVVHLDAAFQPLIRAAKGRSVRIGHRRIAQSRGLRDEQARDRGAHGLLSVDRPRSHPGSSRGDMAVSDSRLFHSLELLLQSRGDEPHIGLLDHRDGSACLLCDGQGIDAMHLKELADPCMSEACTHRLRVVYVTCRVLPRLRRQPPHGPLGPRYGGARAAPRPR
jgi:hypothetical protein